MFNIFGKSKREEPSASSQKPASEPLSGPMTEEVLPYPTPSQEDGMVPTNRMTPSEVPYTIVPETSQTPVEQSGVREVRQPGAPQPTTQPSPGMEVHEMPAMRGSMPAGTEGHWEGDTFVARGTVPVKSEEEAPVTRRDGPPDEKAA